MKQKAIFTLLLLVVATLSFSQADRSDTTKVLFIGNSYTYFNSSPELLKGLAKERFPNQVVETQLISQGGMTLERHWKENRALQAIKSKDWDYVVLQEQSKLGMRVIVDNETHFGQTDLFFAYARKFDAEIKKSNAKTVFFMTWSTEGKPKEQGILTHAYTSIAKELGAILAPVGLAWDKIRNNDQVDLYFVDGSHPSPQGSYLVATTIFATLFGESPVNLSGKISGDQLTSTGAVALESAPLTDISASAAKVIQAASWAAVKKINKKGYPKLKAPKPSYQVPVPAEGANMTQDNITGKWYGTSTYSDDYNGLSLTIESVDKKPHASVSFYTPDRADHMTVTNVTLANNQLHLTIMDSLRSLSTDISFSFADDRLTGTSKSFSGNVTRYKHWNVSRNSIQGELDLAAADALLQEFQTNIESKGYIPAAQHYYAKYSTLIGREYQPEARYLTAMGNILLEDKKVTKALNLFELATVLYPQAVGAYLNYGAALMVAQQQKKALTVYTAGYELAKKTEHKDLASIEASLKKMKTNIAATMPPPPPPPRGGH